MARVLNFLIRYFSNYYTLHRSGLAARVAPLDPRLKLIEILNDVPVYEETTLSTSIILLLLVMYTLCTTL